MRYRVLSPSGDYVFGQGSSEFLVNSPETVAQAVLTRLKLAQGEWFLDLEEGTPYGTQILGENTQSTYDIALRARILDTPGVRSIVAYASSLDTTTRKLTVTCTIDTDFGQTTIQETL